MTSLLSRGLHMADGVVICTLTQAESLRALDITRGSLWASLGPGQTFFKSKDEFALTSLDCFSLTLGRGRRQAAFQRAQLKSKAPGLIYWNHEGSFNWLQWGVQQDFGKPGALLNYLFLMAPYHSLSLSSGLPKSHPFCFTEVGVRCLFSFPKSTEKGVKVFNPSAVNGRYLPAQLRGFRPDRVRDLWAAGSSLQVVTHPVAFTHC